MARDAAYWRTSIGMQRPSALKLALNQRYVVEVSQAAAVDVQPVI